MSTMSAPRNTVFTGIKKNVVVLGIVSFFTDISSEMLYPIIPIFLTTTLGAPASIVGLIEGIAESTASILKAVSGWFSDLVRRRRPFVTAGYSFSSAAKLILFFAHAWPVVLIARFTDRLGKGIRTSPRDAMIADSTDASYRGKAFGFHRAMDSLGACIGPGLAIWFLAAFKDDMRPIFLIAFIPAALSILMLVFFLKEMPTAPVDENRLRRFDFKYLNVPGFKRFLLASSIFAIGNSSDAFLIMRSKSLGLTLPLVIMAYVLYNIFHSLLSTPLGALSDKMPRKSVMLIGYAVFAFVYLGFGLARDAKIVWLLFPVYGAYIAMTDGVGKAFVVDMAEKEFRATALGAYHFVLGIFAFFASLIAGILWTHIGAGAPFFYGAATAATSCIALWILIK